MEGGPGGKICFLCFKKKDLTNKNTQKGKNRRNKKCYFMRDWMLRSRRFVEGKNGLVVGVLFGDGCWRQIRGEGLTDGNK